MMIFRWLKEIWKPRCETCRKLLKDKWFEDYGENFCSRECSDTYAESNKWVKDFRAGVKKVQDYRKEHNLNRPGVIPQTED